MGMFDTIHFRCPECRSEIEEQTKGGVCLLNDYPLHLAPYEAVAGMRKRGICETCGNAWAIHTLFQASVVPASDEDADDDD